MPPSTRIPALLQPYVQLPTPDSILLLTSTLGASANWLLIRFLCNELSTQDGGDEGHNVVLVSWMREYDFWKHEARKGAGLDLEKLRREGRFAFVDGLGAGNATDGSTAARGDAQTTPRVPVSNATPAAQRGPQILPARGPPGRIVPARGPPPSAPAAAPAPMPATNTSNGLASASKTTPGQYTLKSLDIADIKSTISSAISPLATSATRKTLLIFDNPDLLLALNPAITPSDFTTLMLQFHTLPNVSHILTHIQADNPLLSLSTPPQPLEVAHHNLLVKCAHMSRRILGVRILDTGVARDVSGVIRVTEQRKQWFDVGFGIQENKTGDDSGRGKEFLYQVKSDGSVRVFERGAGGDG
jgi:elongator complex protein 6